MYRRNKIGPRTEPCGTQKSTADDIELDVAVQTCCVRLLRYDVNQLMDDLLAKAIQHAQLLKERLNAWNSSSVSIVSCRVQITMRQYSKLKSKKSENNQHVARYVGFAQQDLDSGHFAED